MAVQKSAREWAADYAATRPLYEAFVARLAMLVEELLRGAGIGFAQVERRAKEVDSFEEKITREQGRYESPLTEITDLAGIRPIVYYTSDVDRVAELLNDEFSIDTENSLSALDRLGDDRFGYVSDHYVIRLDGARAGLGEWDPYVDLVAEVQVRTVLQHAWAAIDHRLNYKSSADIPRELKRRLFRVSALLEVADDQFEAVRVASDELGERYDAQVQAGDLDLEVDAASVPRYVASSEVAKAWIEAGREVGFEVSPWHDDDDGPDPLIEVLRLAGITKIREFDDFLRAAAPWGRKVLRGVGPDATGYASDEFLLALLLIGGAEALDIDELFERRRYSPSFVEAVKNTRSSILEDQE